MMYEDFSSSKRNWYLIYFGSEKLFENDTYRQNDVLRSSDALNFLFGRNVIGCDDDRPHVWTLGHMFRGVFLECRRLLVFEVVFDGTVKRMKSTLFFVQILTRIQLYIIKLPTILNLWRRFDVGQVMSPINHVPQSWKSFFIPFCEEILHTLCHFREFLSVRIIFEFSYCNPMTQILDFNVFLLDKWSLLKSTYGLVSSSDHSFWNREISISKTLQLSFWVLFWIDVNFSFVS